MGTRRGPSKRARVSMNEKNGRMAHPRMVAGQGILRNHRRNNNSPATGTAPAGGAGIARFSRHAGICAAVEATPLSGSRAGPTATEPIPDCSRATTDTFRAAIIFLIGCALRTASSSHERGMNAGNAVTPRRAGLVPIWPALLVSIL
jgi:hypothetical protein